MGYILSNMSANLFGLGNAATPMGLKAMEEFAKIKPRFQDSDTGDVYIAGPQYIGAYLNPHYDYRHSA
jgi:spore maturation protein SpmA